MNKIIFLSISLIALFTPKSLAQFAANELDEAFLEGLPPSIREQVETANQVNKDEELDRLFRTDTSVEKNKFILQRLKDEINALEQQISSDNEIDTGLEKYGTSFFRTLQSSFMPVNIPNMSGDYIIDVGDAFDIYISGEPSVEEVKVNRDGSILIPDIGKVFVAKKSLNNVNEIVKASAAEKLIGTEVELSLSSLRDMQVIILGGVENPGIYTLSGGSNFLGAINVAGGIAENGSFRSIDIKRDGKLIQNVDLYDIFISGLIPNNFVLQSGDTVFINPYKIGVPVTGGVNFDYIFEAKPEETYQDLINFAGGFSSSFFGYDHIIVKQTGIDGTRTIKILRNNLDKFSIKPRDSILVPEFRASIESQKIISIEGNVRKPGKYTISEQETLLDVINLAGGFDDDAYPYASMLLREQSVETEKLFAQLNYKETLNYIVSNLGQGGGSINTGIFDLLAEEIRAQNFTGRIITSFDLSEIENDPSKNVQVMNGDKIIVPALQKVVYLFGDFNNPVTAKYQPNSNIRDYLKVAGGLKKSAYKNLVVIDPDGTTHLYKGSSLLSSAIEIYPGSIIYAPRNIGKLDGVRYASAIAPILSSLAISLASLNSIQD